MPTTSEAISQDLALTPGSVVGNHRLIGPLACGGMAQVWAAEPVRDTGVVTTVAIKVMRPDISDDDRYAAMFIDEANVAMAVTHPNVCRTFELGRHGDLLYMCMEWVAGDSLAGMLRKEGEITPLEPAIAVRIVANALVGLHAAHEIHDEAGQPLNVIHRDVSPPNILISLTGQVKVSDFGIAKARHQLHERTKTGEVKGKFGYLAPEQITGGPADRRVDVYAMGCVLYVATLGLRPFGHGPESMSKILRGQVKLPSEVDRNFSPGLELIIRTAISRKPADRYRTAEEMRIALERWLITERRVVTQGQIAAALKQRISDEMFQVIQQIQRRRGKDTAIDSRPAPIDEPETASTRHSIRRFPQLSSLNEEPTLQEAYVPASVRSRRSDPP